MARLLITVLNVLLSANYVGAVRCTGVPTNEKNVANVVLRNNDDEHLKNHGGQITTRGKIASRFVIKPNLEFI